MELHRFLCLDVHKLDWAEMELKPEEKSGSNPELTSCSWKKLILPGVCLEAFPVDFLHDRSKLKQIVYNSVTQKNCAVEMCTFWICVNFHQKFGTNKHLGLRSYL